VTRVDTEVDFRSSLAQGGLRSDLSQTTRFPSSTHFALNLAREMLPDVPFIFLSGTLDEEVAIDALKIGATTTCSRRAVEDVPSCYARYARPGKESKLQRSEAAVRASEKSLRLIVDRIPGS